MKGGHLRREVGGILLAGTVSGNRWQEVCLRNETVLLAE
jgi:hypothetical protein